VQTVFSQDVLIGVKYSLKRGRFVSHALTSGVLWVELFARSFSGKYSNKVVEFGQCLLQDLLVCGYCSS